MTFWATSVVPSVGITLKTYHGEVFIQEKDDPLKTSYQCCYKGRSHFVPDLTLMLDVIAKRRVRGQDMPGFVSRPPYSSSYSLKKTTYTCGSIHPGRVEPSSSKKLTTPKIEATQTRLLCESSLKTFTQSCLHRAQPKIGYQKKGSRSSFSVAVHDFRWLLRTRWCG